MSSLSGSRRASWCLSPPSPPLLHIQLWVEGQALAKWGEQIALMEFIPIFPPAKPREASDDSLLVKMIHPVHFLLICSDLFDPLGKVKKRKIEAAAKEEEGERGRTSPKERVIQC